MIGQKIIRKIVEGVHSRDVFKEYADVVTYASVSENDQIKEFLFDKLYKIGRAHV